MTAEILRKKENSELKAALEEIESEPGLTGAERAAARELVLYGAQMTVVDREPDATHANR